MLSLSALALTSSARTFGGFVRDKRAEHSLTLGFVARAIEVTPSYVSDVERGRRAPFPDRKLPALAEVLRVPVDELVELARLSRGITLDSRSREHQDAALALARAWARLTPQQLEAIAEIANGGRPIPEE